MLQEAEAGNDSLADLRHADELDRMKSRLWGLVDAITGMDGDDNGGVVQLAYDFAYQMEDCAEAFSQMHYMRRSRTEAA